MGLSGLTSDYIGSKIKIFVPDGQYEGTVFAVDLNGQKITLEKVTSCRTGKEIKGMQNYFSYEIKKIEITSDKRMAARQSGKSDGTKLVRGKQVDSHVKEIRSLNREEMLLKSTVGLTRKENGIDEGPRIVRVKTLQEAQRKTPADVLSLQQWPQHYLVISKDGSLFKDAMIHIQSQAVIGIAIEGTKPGRRGTISFLQVGTRAYGFVFDVLSLGRTLFEEGLKTILEHPKIQKVLCDCRMVSDALFHQYGVKLLNVFDTQVADVFVYRNQHSGDMPRYVQGINILLFNYLNVKANEANFKQRENVLETDQKVWLTRPAPQRVVEVAVRHVMYLIALRASLMEAMLQDFTDGVDIYLGVVRDATEDKLDRYEKTPHLLPYEFHNVRSESQRLRHIYNTRYRDKGGATSMWAPNGFRENCIGSLDHSVIYSSDGVWRKGEGRDVQPRSTTQTLQECHRVGQYWRNEPKHANLAKLAAQEEERAMAKKQTEEEDDSLMAMSEKEPAAERQKPKAAVPRPAPSPIVQVPHTTYLPDGCTLKNVEFTHRDIRVTRPDIRREQLDDTDSNDLIPSHASLVRADPVHHKAVTTDAPKLAWQKILAESDSSTSSSSSSSSSSSRVSNTELRSPLPHAVRTGGGTGSQGLAHPPAGRGLIGRAMQAVPKPCAALSAGEPVSTTGEASREERPPPALGRGQMMLRLLSETKNPGVASGRGTAQHRTTQGQFSD